MASRHGLLFFFIIFALHNLAFVKPGMFVFLIRHSVDPDGFGVFFMVPESGCKAFFKRSSEELVFSVNADFERLQVVYSHFCVACRNLLYFI